MAVRRPEAPRILRFLGWASPRAASVLQLPLQCPNLSLCHAACRHSDLFLAQIKFPVPALRYLLDLKVPTDRLVAEFLRAINAWEAAALAKRVRAARSDVGGRGAGDFDTYPRS